MTKESPHNLWYPDRMRFPVILLAVILTDFLLYNAAIPGSIPLTLFYLLLLVAAWPRRLDFLSKSARILWGVQLGLCGIGVFWYADGFASAFAFCSLLLFRVVCREEAADTSIGRWILKLLVLAFSFLLDGFYQIRSGCRRLDEAKGIFSRLAKGLLLWVLPILGALMFLLFFSEANPILARWVDRFTEWLRSIDFPSAGRVFFWGATALLTAAVTGLSFWKRIYTVLQANALRLEWNNLPPSASQVLAKIITRGLLLFNLVFVVQNLLDIEYLWAGAALPGGMSYAEYAHRGAYPLIATALIAAGLTVLTFSGTCTGSDWKWARRLVYLWLGQNVFLVASSLLRLEKYVAVYSLTGLRVAAAVWMLIVGVGLCLIFYKIWKDKSLRWLFWANGAQLLIVLLAVMFFDSSRFIAEYNFAHCREAVGMTEEGIPPARLDAEYMRVLMPSSLPVLVRMQKTGLPMPSRFALPWEIRKLEGSLGSWRTWTLSNARILRDVKRASGN